MKRTKVRSQALDSGILQVVRHEFHRTRHGTIIPVMSERFIEYGYMERPEDPLPEQIAPPEDNPLPRWLRLGVALAGTHTRISEPALWTRDFNFNPVLIYLMGRRRGRWIDDAVGFAPWVVLTLVELVVALIAVNPSRFGDALTILVVMPLLAAPLVGLWSMRIVAHTLDETFRKISFDQLAITRLSADQVLHGLVIRALAVQTLGCLINIGFWIPLVAITALTSSRSGAGVLYQVGAGVALLLFRWTLFSSCVMEGAALAARACCFIRSASVAYVRMWIDWGRRMVIPMIILAVLGLLLLVSLLLSGVLIVGCLLVLAYYVRLGFTAEDVMRWVAEYRMEWWAVSGEEGAFAPTLPWRRWRSPDPEFSDVPQP